MLIGPRNDRLCANINIRNEDEIPWVDEIRYLGIFIVRSPGRLKMREWKMRYGQNCKGGKCRSGKCRSKPYGTPTRDYIEKALSYFVILVLILLTE